MYDFLGNLEHGYVANRRYTESCTSWDEQRRARFFETLIFFTGELTKLFTKLLICSWVNCGQFEPFLMYHNRDAFQKPNKKTAIKLLH